MATNTGCRFSRSLGGRQASLLSADHSLMMGQKTLRPEKDSVSAWGTPPSKSANATPPQKKTASWRKTCSKSHHPGLLPVRIPRISGRSFWGAVMMFNHCGQFSTDLTQQAVLELLKLQQSIDIIQHLPSLRRKRAIIGRVRWGQLLCHWRYGFLAEEGR